MTNEKQLEFIEHELCNMSLKGIPGGGKTKSIIDKILYLYDQNIIHSSNDFLILTFTRNAKGDFLRKGKLKKSKLNWFQNENECCLRHSLVQYLVEVEKDDQCFRNALFQLSFAGNRESSE